MTTKEGKISANVFVSPRNIPDDTFLFEYSLFFISVLYDLHQAHPDEALVKELYPTAKKQIDLSLQMFDENGCLIPDEDYPCLLYTSELVSNIIAGNHGNDHEKSASAQSDADHGGRLDYNTYIEEFVSVFAAGCGSKKDAADQTGDVKRDSAAC